MRTLIGLLLVLGLALGTAQGREIEGVEFPGEVAIDGQTAVLNGGGLRSRFFVRIYVAALYLPGTTGDPQTALDMAGNKRVALVMQRAVDKDTMVDALEDGLAANLGPGELDALAAETAAFRELFGDFADGDRIELDFLDDEGIRVTVNDDTRGRVDNAAFARAVLSIWLGDNPADRRVKRGMLGR